MKCDRCNLDTQTIATITCENNTKDDLCLGCVISELLERISTLERRMNDLPAEIQRQLEEKP